METTGNQNVDLNSQFGTIVATHPHLQLNRNSILSRPPSISFVVHPCPSFARFCESRISSKLVLSSVSYGRKICRGNGNRIYKPETGLKLAKLIKWRLSEYMRKEHLKKRTGRLLSRIVGETSLSFSRLSGFF